MQAPVLGLAGAPPSRRPPVRVRASAGDIDPNGDVAGVVDRRYHPAGRCWLCGHRYDLKQTRALLTGAHALACRDVVACVRRQYRQKVAA